MILKTWRYKLITMSKTYNFCNNCGKVGHAFHQCKHPITSTGIIAFRKSANTSKLEYLMIRRKDTLGFVDFMRGKYPIYCKRYLMNIINEMTQNEKKKLLSNSFNQLWIELWGGNIGIQYRGEEKTSKDKFNILRDEGIVCGTVKYTLKSLIEESNTNWIEPEWGFPKGRRNYQEKDLHCALREFEEETGYPKTCLKIIQNVNPFEEIFTGSNYKSYKHRYYIAYMDATNISLKPHQTTEVSKVDWKDYTQVLRCIRPYNIEKQIITKNVNKLLNSNKLYQ